MFSEKELMASFHHSHNRTMGKLPRAFSYRLAGKLIPECLERATPRITPDFRGNIVPRADGGPGVCAVDADD